MLSCRRDRDLHLGHRRKPNSKMPSRHNHFCGEQATRVKTKKASMVNVRILTNG